MNHILTDGDERQVGNYARTRTCNLFAQGIKDSTVFCLGENKQTIEQNLRKYVESILKELSLRKYATNQKAYHVVRKFYAQNLSERLGSLPPGMVDTSTRLYDVIKLTLGAGQDGIPAIFASLYPVDSENIDGDYVQPDFTLRVPLIYGNKSIFRNRADNKAAVTMYGISLATLEAVRTHMSRLTEVPVPFKEPIFNDDDSVPMVEQTTLGEMDDDSMPENLNHAATVVDSIRRSSQVHA